MKHATNTNSLSCCLANIGNYICCMIKILLKILFKLIKIGTFSVINLKNSHIIIAAVASAI